MNNKLFSFKQQGSCRPAAIMFDLDGTLVDTMGGFADLAAELINRDFGVEFSLARQRYIETSGFPFCQQIEMIFPKDSRNAQTASDFELRKRSVCELSHMDKKTIATLELLQKNNIRVAVSSNSSQHYVDCFAANEPFTFDLVLGFGNGLAKGRPHIKAVAQKFGVNFDQILFVGDSVNDAKITRACEVNFVALLGTFEAKNFYDVFPDTPVICEISDLKQMLNLSEILKA